jgi:hypothetical protein
MTIGNTNVVFPNPGPNVKYGGVYASSKPTTPFGFTGTNCVGAGAVEVATGGGGGGNAASSGGGGGGVASSSSNPVASSTIAVTSQTTLYTVPSSLYASTSTSATSATASATQCTRRRKRSVDGHIDRRNERLVRRPVQRDGVKRVAAGKAEHLSR